MKFYKFRSLNNTEFAFDILINNRLYCASYESLNDPFEGEFVAIIHYSGMGLLGGGLLGDGLLGGGLLGGGLMNGGGIRRKHQSIKDTPLFSDKVRICSLSETLSDVRMWAHYAGGHEGVAIEIEVDETHENLVKIAYHDGLRQINRSMIEKSTAKELLSYKTIHWEYEKEWRIIQEGEYYDISGKITAVYLGSRISLLNKTLIRKTLPIDIPLFETNLDRHTISVQPGTKVERI